MKEKLMRGLSIFIGLTVYLSATVYENAEDGSITKWEVYDTTPEGATIKNVIDNEHGRVIELTGEEKENGFRIGNIHAHLNAWDNSDERILQWSMKSSEDFEIFVSLNTSNGHRYLIYTDTDNDTAYQYGLGINAKDGTWKTYNRNLKVDFYKIEPNNTILSVDGFFVRGSGYFDDIALLKKENCKNLLNWHIYDNTPSGARIQLKHDEDKGNVIQLLGDEKENGYALGNTHGRELSWNDTINRRLKWSMKYNESFEIFVSLNTSNGHRYLIYTDTDNDTAYQYGLGIDAKDGKWRSYDRDLKADFYKIEPDNPILSVDGFFIRGSGLIECVSLEKSIVEEYSNLLDGKNPNINGTEGYSGIENHEYISDVSHTNDGSGSIKLVGHWYTKQFATASFHLEKGKHYTMGAYMKALGADQGQNVMFKISGDGHRDEMNWNISKAGEWEEILMPYRADVTGEYTISIFTFRYALTTNHKFALEDGSTLDRNASILFDDFFVYESDKIVSNESPTEKVPFNSSFIKIDKLGNWSIKENNVWRNFFPKFTYQDYVENFERQSQMYSNYGFTGYTNLSNIYKVHKAIENGMKYNGIQINEMDVDNPNDSTKKIISDIHNEIESGALPATAIIFYEYDNEEEWLTNYQQKKLVADWIDINDKDSITHDRARPINMLNGVAEGVARNYKNSSNKNYIDTVGTYITQIGHDADAHKNPINTLGILEKTHNQIAPVSIMQLQCHYKNVFIPSIFKGIGSGAKGLNFWRAGGGLPSTCEEDFEDNVWVPVIKNVFSKIDTMLPIIKEPLETYWSAKVDNPELVSIGTRDHNGKHYLILANFGYNDSSIKVSLSNLSVNNVRDFFTQTLLTNVDSTGEFVVSIGHHNNGFLVLELD